MSRCPGCGEFHSREWDRLAAMMTAIGNGKVHITDLDDAIVAAIDKKSGGRNAELRAEAERRRADHLERAAWFAEEHPDPEPDPDQADWWWTE